MDIKLTPETLLEDELEIDSLERVELGIKLEKTFLLQLSDSDIRECTTLGDLMCLLIQTLQRSKKDVL